MSKAATSPARAEDADWFHGRLPHNDAVEVVTEPGQFLVRVRDEGPSMQVVLSACSQDKKFINMTVRQDNEPSPWHLKEGKRFKTIEAMIAHYRKSPPSDSCKLKTVVPRRVWLLGKANVHYESKAQLGKGRYSTAFKGSLAIGNTRSTVVVKRVNALKWESNETEVSLPAFLEEARYVAYRTHHSIVNVVGVEVCAMPYFVVMEYCPGGDLYHHLQKRGKDIGTTERLLYCFEVSLGVAYVHSKNRVVRDLSTKNVLVSARGELKIDCFGPSALFKRKEKKVDLSSLWWIATESLPGLATVESDVWNLGVVIYQIFSNGSKPWPVPSEIIEERIRQVKQTVMPQGMLAPVAALVPRMWTTSFGEQPSSAAVATDILNLYEQQKEPAASSLIINKISHVKRTELIKKARRPWEGKMTEAEEENCMRQVESAILP